MKSLFIICCLSVVSALSWGQEIINSGHYLLHNNNGARINFADATYDPDLSVISLYTVSYIRKPNDSRLHQQMNIVKINAGDFSVIRKDSLVGTVEKTLKKMHSTNPNFLRKQQSEEKAFKVVPSWGNFYIYLQDGDELKTSKSEQPQIDDKIIIHPHHIINEAERSFFALYGNRKKGKEFRNNEYQELKLAKHNTQGEIENLADISLAHPRDVIYSAKVAKPSLRYSDQQDFEKAVFILGKPKDIRKKDGDPDYATYEIICIDNNGNILFLHQFPAGTEKTHLNPSYVYESGGNIIVLAKLEGNDPSLAHFAFDASGLKHVADYPYKTLNPTDERQLSLTFSKYFDVNSHVILSDGSIMLAGHAVEEETVTTPANPEAGIPASSVVKRLPYRFNILRFDNQLKYINQYSTPTTKHTKPEMIEIEGRHYLLFNVGSNPKVDFNLGRTVITDKAAATGEIVEDISYEPPVAHDSAPVIVSLDSEQDNFNFEKQNLYNINNQARFFVDNEGNLLVIGVKGNNGAMIQSTDKWPVKAYMMRIKL